MYGGGCSALGLVATSSHARDAGLQQPLMDVLLAHGVGLDALAGGNSSRIVNSCLANGRPEAAEYLAKPEHRSIWKPPQGSAGSIW